MVSETFGPDYARTLRRRGGRLGDTWYLDKLFVTIQGRRQYLWRAVDQDGDVIDILVQPRRNRHAAAHRVVMPAVIHSRRQYENNRAEVSHQPTRHRERQMRGFTSVAHAQRFLSVHGIVLNLFRVGRHLLRAAHHRFWRRRAFGVWHEATGA